MILDSNTPEMVSSFLDKVCIEVRNEVISHDSEVDRLQKKTTTFLEKVKPEELVYCSALLQDVIFLEPPKYKYGWCKYKTRDGKIKEAPPHCFSIISKGDKHGEYKTKDLKKANWYYLIARGYGFRVKKKKIDNYYVLTIYGDKQDEIDNFFFNLNKDLILDEY